MLAITLYDYVLDDVRFEGSTEKKKRNGVVVHVTLRIHIWLSSTSIFSFKNGLLYDHDVRKYCVSRAGARDKKQKCM